MCLLVPQALKETEVTTYRLPPRFIADHESRDLLDLTARPVRRLARAVVVELTDDEARSLLLDAQHYADPDQGYSDEMRGLAASARATVRVLLSVRADLDEPAERALSVPEHVQQIEQWIAETEFDQGLSGDEIACDVVSSYIAAEVDGGETSSAARQIRRSMFGQG
jgi:hypothetical protein